MHESPYRLGGAWPTRERADLAARTLAVSLAATFETPDPLGWTPRTWSDELPRCYHAAARSTCGRLEVAPIYRAARLLGYHATLASPGSTVPGGRWVGNGAIPAAAALDAVHKAHRGARNIGRHLRGLAAPILPPSLEEAVLDARHVRGLAESADALAESADGPVPATWEAMDREDLAVFFRSAYRLAGAVLEARP